METDAPCSESDDATPRHGERQLSAKCTWHHTCTGRHALACSGYRDLVVSAHIQLQTPLTDSGFTLINQSTPTPRDQKPPL